MVLNTFEGWLCDIFGPTVSCNNMQGLNMLSESLTAEKS